jgi:hypothetical protein
MSSDQENVILDKILAKPATLEAERVGQEYLISELRADHLPNQANMVTMMMMQNFYKGKTDPESAAITETIDKLVKEENRYLFEAMNLLAGDVSKLAAKGIKPEIALNLRSKYGRGLDGAAVLANLLRTQSNKIEFEETIAPIVKDLVDTRRIDTGSKALFK